jgi:hypothetical protein
MHIELSSRVYQSYSFMPLCWSARESSMTSNHSMNLRITSSSVCILFFNSCDWGKLHPHLGPKEGEQSPHSLLNAVWEDYNCNDMKFLCGRLWIEGQNLILAPGTAPPGVRSQPHVCARMPSSIHNRYLLFWDWRVVNVTFPTSNSCFASRNLAMLWHRFLLNTDYRQQTGLGRNFQQHWPGQKTDSCEFPCKTMYPNDLTQCYTFKSAFRLAWSL